MKEIHTVLLRRALLAACSIALLLSACKAPPTEEMNNANDAVTRAENDADAVTYAGNTLVRARDALTRMQSEADAKRYEEAKNFAAEAVTLAEKAVADGKTGAERAREEAANLVSGVAGSLSETVTYIDAARQVKNIRVDFDRVAAEMDTATQTYNEARQRLDEGNYAEAAAKSGDARSALADINSRLTEAVEASSRKQ